MGESGLSGCLTCYIVMITHRKKLMKILFSLNILWIRLMCFFIFNEYSWNWKYVVRNTIILQVQTLNQTHSYYVNYHQICKHFHQHYYASSTKTISNSFLEKCSNQIKIYKKNKHYLYTNITMLLLIVFITNWTKWTQ